MTIRKKLFPVTGVLLLALAVVVATHGKAKTTQPITFNHQLHTGEVGLECIHCHRGVETGPFATLPQTPVCLECHETPLTDSAEESKIRDYGNGRPDIPWIRLTRQPEHVYFSHQRHVAFGKVPCERCHGEMAKRTEPPSSAPMELEMNDCLECHKKSKASVDCIACHR